MNALLPFPQPATSSIPHSALPPRRTGKVARLPKATRQRINRMLDENLPYHTIIAQLGEAGKDLNPQNLSNWVQGGYQDYLRHQDTLDLLKDQLEFATDLLAQVPDPSAIFQALRLIAGLQLNHFLLENGPKLLETDPAAYSRLVQNICNLSRAELQFCKHRTTQAQVLSAPAKPIDYTRPLTERETQLIVAKLNRLFGYSEEPSRPIQPDQASAHPVGTASTPSQTVSAVAFASAIKPIQGSIVEAGFQPPAPVQSTSTAIKVDQASTQPAGTDPAPSQTVPAVASAGAIKPIQGSVVAVGFQPPAPAQSTSTAIKVDQTSAHPVRTASTPSQTVSAVASASPIKADQATTQAAATVRPPGGVAAQSLQFKVQGSEFAVQSSPS